MGCWGSGLLTGLGVFCGLFGFVVDNRTVVRASAQAYARECWGFALPPRFTFVEGW